MKLKKEENKTKLFEQIIFDCIYLDSIRSNEHNIKQMSLEIRLFAVVPQIDKSLNFFFFPSLYSLFIPYGIWMQLLGHKNAHTNKWYKWRHIYYDLIKNGSTTKIWRRAKIKTNTNMRLIFFLEREKKKQNKLRDINTEQKNCIVLNTVLPV